LNQWPWFLSKTIDKSIKEDHPNIRQMSTSELSEMLAKEDDEIPVPMQRGLWESSSE
jgi:hypothetical protein